MTTRRRTLIAAVTCAIALSVALAGCSAHPSDHASSAAGSNEGRQAKQAACLRAKGHDVPDPGADGTADAQAALGNDPERFLADAETCAKETGVELGTAKPPTESQTRAVATCVRGHGFADFPDDAEGQAQYTTGDTAALSSAQEECFEQEVLEDR